MSEEEKKADADREAPMREAQDWVVRLTSGEATAEVAEALQRWRKKSREHRRAFAEANLMWDRLHAAATQSKAKQQLAAERRAAATVRPLTRRMFFGGMAVSGAAVAAYAVVRPPLHLWPSLAEVTADYRTDVGQQQQLVIIDDVSLKLNTRTSVALLSRDNTNTGRGADRIELIAGEAAVSTSARAARPIVVIAAQGRTIATSARFNVRYEDSEVCVSCLEGEARVEQAGQIATLRAGEQVVYTAEALGVVTQTDPDVVDAWQRGLLVFRNEPLSHVIDEVNRYRRGRIILTNAELGRRPVLATFRIDRIDEVLPRLQAVFNVKTRALPGGIVLVG